MMATGMTRLAVVCAVAAVIVLSGPPAVAPGAHQHPELDVGPPEALFPHVFEDFPPQMSMLVLDVEVEQVVVLQSVFLWDSFEAIVFVADGQHVHRADLLVTDGLDPIEKIAGILEIDDEPDSGIAAGEMHIVFPNAPSSPSWDYKMQIEADGKTFTTEKISFFGQGPHTPGGLEGSDGPASRSEPPRMGLGLETPSRFPQPGAFLEPPDAMERLEWYLENRLPVLGRMCGLEASANQTMTRDHHLTVLTNFSLACGDRASGVAAINFDQPRQLDVWVAELISHGTLDATYAELEQSARLEVDRTWQALDEAPTPADPVEAQILAWLMANAKWDRDLLDTAQRLYEKYQETGQFLHAVDIFLNLNSSAAEAKLARAILHDYPWQDPGCSSTTDPVETEQRLREKIRRAINDHPRTDPDARPDYGEPPDRFVFHYEANLIDVEGRGWWPYLLWQEQSLDWWVAVADNPGNTYPTVEEAMYLVQAYRNHTRTLTTESSLGKLEPEGFEFIPWYDDLYYPRLVLNIDALQWRFGEVGCLEG